MANLVVPDVTQAVHIGDFSKMRRTGIYFLLDGDVVVYVGQARNIRSRVAQHIGEGTKAFNSVVFVVCKPESLDYLERAYIEKLMPRYNRCHFSKGLRSLGIESSTGSKLIGVQKKIRIPRANVRRTITVFN